MTRELDQQLGARHTEMQYNEVGKIAKQQTPLQVTNSSATTYCYDDDERLAYMISPRAGDLSCGTTNAYQTDYTYDEAGRQTGVETPEATTSTSYDRAGRVESRTDANGNTTTYGYDEVGRLDTVAAPSHPTLGARITNYTYNEVGDLVTRSDANADETSYTYDAAHQLVSKEMPDGELWSYGYDVDGNLTSKVDANGNDTLTSGDGTTTYAYDRAGQQTGIDYSDSTPDVTYTYTRTGQVKTAAAGSTSETYTYDAMDRLASVTRGSDVFSYAHDADGNVTSRTYPGQSAVAYEYDDDGQLTKVDQGTPETDYAYDDAGNLLTTTLPNGIVESRTYDDADRVTRIRTVDGSSNVVDDLQYTLDDVGNPLSLVTPSRTEVYAYDELNQLESVCFQSTCPDPEDLQIAYTYDKLGNRVTETRGDGTTSTTLTNCYASDGSNELTVSITMGNCFSATPTNDYDHNGNLVDDGARTYDYDLENRLASTTASSVTTDYTYDAQGKRITADDGTTAHDYQWDTTYPNAQLALDSTSSTDRTYTYGLGRVGTDDGTDTQYFLADRIGSTTHLTDTSGNVDWSYTYEPFGTPIAATQVDMSAPGTDMGYAGEQLDPTGLIHLRARTYDPSTGRFTAVDPLETRNELDLKDPYVSAYVYANNDPTMLADPSGEDAALVVTQRSAQVALRFVQLAAAVSGACLKAKAVTVACSLAAMSFIWLGWEALEEDELPAYGTTAGDDYWGTSPTTSTTGSADASESQSNTDTDEQERKCKNRPGCTVFHYTNYDAVPYIARDGYLKPGRAGFIWLSPLRYTSASEAEEKLALPRKPDCSYRVPYKNVTAPSAMTPVRQRYGHQGGGIEFTTQFNVPIGRNSVCEPLAA